MRSAIVLLLLFGCSSADKDVMEDPVDPLVCGVSSDLVDAPEPIETSAGLVAAVDLLSVVATAVMVEDGLQIDATARFLVGEDEGAAVLELGPAAEQTSVALSRVTVSDPPRELVVLGEDYERCSEQELTVSYTLPIDWMAVAGEQFRLEQYPEGLFWSSGLQDSTPGRFLGLWTPSNLLFDRFDLELEIDASALPEEHVLATTGEAAETSSGWSITWTGIQAHAPLWVVSPASITEGDERVVALADGDVTVEARALPMDARLIPEALDRAEVSLQQFSEEFGPYSHGDRYVLWIRDDLESSMEFDGGTVTAMGALEHEVMHSWFGRGASPVADRDGWVDEAMTAYVTNFLQTPVGFSYDSAPLNLLVGGDRWAGADLNVGPYLFGGAIFAGLANDHGVIETREALGAFYRAFVGDSYSTEQIEEFFTCWFDDDEVRQLFSHRAYGDPSPVDPRPDDWCP